MRGRCSQQIGSQLLPFGPSLQTRYRNPLCLVCGGRDRGNKKIRLRRIEGAHTTYSVSGVLKTRSRPNSSASPSVHLNTPPKPTSSPNTMAESSFVRIMLIASRMAWYVFIFRVSRPPPMSEVDVGASSVHLIPGVLSDNSRVVRRRVVLLRSSRPSAAGGPAEVDSHLEFAVLACVEKHERELTVQRKRG